jgi:hypothetical protein
VADLRKTLQEVILDVRQGNKPVSTPLSAEEIDQIVVFFFNDVFGSAARQRVAKMLAYADRVDIFGTDHGAGQRAAALALDDEVLPVFRRFFRSFGSYHGACHTASSQYKRIQRHWDQFSIYAGFMALNKYADDEPKNALAFLAKHGLYPAEGVRFLSLTMTYLARAIDLGKEQLQNVLQQSQSVHLLAATFGTGILALMPPNTSYV